ncbi:metallophosphoesterase family protein [Knoellia locipacati]|uniref:metallophosphoesterase family protein n=1 Tax=Knoellia locipacati TaxID=882824 RepID=UPI00164CD5BE|nr:metallophosphoesterase [Knoellia locipacati]
MKIAVISDIHAYTAAQLEPGELRPSFVEVSNPSDLPGQNPFSALKALIDQESLTADFLVCAGDMGDKAHPDAIRYSWERVRALAKQLGDATIVVTSGNHDLDSRYMYNDYDAKATLQGLEEYPFDSGAKNNEYWARNAVVIETEAVRWAVLNSAAYHGYAEEWKHGRISKRTLAYLEELLKSTSQDKLNVLVCHHHVYKIGSVDLGDYSAMEAGSALLQLLESAKYGNWLVIHGHRHWPSVTYAPGSNSSPVVFSAGSLSAVLYDELADKARNQFYILELDTPPQAGRMRGRFKAWDWVSDEGFSPAQARSGLPHDGGFGSTKAGSTLADDIHVAFGSLGDQFAPWSKMVELVPDLLHSTPNDMAVCISRLDTHYGLIVLEHNGRRHQIGRA